METLCILLVLLAVARTLGELAVRFRQPALVGELIGGILAGVIAAVFSEYLPVLAGLPALWMGLSRREAIAVGTAMSTAERWNHVHVYDDRVRLQGFGLPDSFFAVRRFADDFEIGLAVQQSDKAFAHHGVVIYNEQLNYSALGTRGHATS